MSNEYTSYYHASEPGATLRLRIIRRCPLQPLDSNSQRRKRHRKTKRKQQNVPGYNVQISTEEKIDEIYYNADDHDNDKTKTTTTF